jgi:F0F1-type ATP synthase membrane subunit c/vacuolar-type H+-ATPase subunit K
MIQAAKIIAIVLATIGLIGAGVGIGVVFGPIISMYRKRPNNSNIRTSFFTRKNISRILIVFLVGLSCRIIIEELLHIRVFSDYMH